MFTRKFNHTITIVGAGIELACGLAFVAACVLGAIALQPLFR